MNQELVALFDQFPLDVRKPREKRDTSTNTEKKPHDTKPLYKRWHPFDEATSS